ncbi:hypothetical protein KU06062604_780008 [Flavobacterium psychrophilum]|uniref:hypothetical protein n=1 Tax=Flavobacterium psychrophilum TaxID=96345 RepID=UPI000B7C4A5F|nr:hypothetical protein [Flavobacterium psychrophilum]SNB22487.1 hypothetical protein KU06062604_780008 [Flavobacterium psychrophilum]
MKNKINGNDNFTAQRDVNVYQSSVDTSENEFGVINDIFNYVIKVANEKELVDSKKALTTDKLVHLNEKIKINFQNENDINEVKIYFTQLFSKINAVEKSFQTLDENDQQDVHFFVSSNYYDIKREEENKIVILKKLANFFIPPNQIKNPTYFSISQAIVLFFFDDCTIFEKTKSEINLQTNLFDNI